MTAKLLIHPNVPAKDILIKSIKNGVDWSVSDRPDDGGTDRLGLIYHNQFSHIPFGTSELKIDGHRFVYFKKEMYDYLTQYQPHDLDLLTCDMIDPMFIDEVRRLKTILPNISINYSLDRTGGEIDSNWTMESNGQSVKDVYFNQQINNYTYSLGSLNAHSAIIMSDQTVRTFGSNAQGQLGTRYLPRSTVPIDVFGITNVLMNFPSISGSDHTAVILDDGSVQTFGANFFGQLGIGSEDNNRNTQPLAVCGIVNATAVACGQFHTAVLLAGGTVRTFGANDTGQLGNGTLDGQNVPVVVCQIVNATMVSCGENHNAVVLNDGTVCTFGYNSGGQLGNGNNIDSSVPFVVSGIGTANGVACGGYHTVVLLNSGSVVSFGNNDYGQLGDGTTTSSNVWIGVCGIVNAMMVACGSLHTAVLLADGTVRTFGWNGSGQLGDGTNIDQSQPVLVCGINNAMAIACGSAHTAVLLNDGTVCTFGANNGGQLGNGTLNDSNLPVAVCGINNAVEIACGGSNTVIKLSDGTVRTFGLNTFGQLGDGYSLFKSSTLLEVPTISNATMVSCGLWHTAVVLADGMVRTFGQNSAGQLGDGTNNESGAPVMVCQIVCATMVACGAAHTAVLLSDHTVQTFGYGQWGQLGNGANDDSNVPVQVSGIVNATAVSCGSDYTAVLLSGGTVRTFGYNPYGQLGNGSNDDQNVPVQVCGIENAMAVACGGLHTAVLTSGGTVSTFGFNVYGQLGNGTNDDANQPVTVCGIDNAIAVACGANHTAVVLSGGTVRTFGVNNNGQLGNGNNADQNQPVLVCQITNAIAVACGSLHTAILLDDGTIRSFGYNEQGQLGDGFFVNSNMPVAVVLQPVMRSLDRSSSSVRVFRIWDSLLGSIYCVHEDNLVLTKRGYVAIKEVVEGDTVYDQRHREVEVLYNIKMLTPNREYIKIEKNAFRPSVPLNDLLIVKGHPVKYKNREIDCEKLVGLVAGVTEVTMGQSSYVYCLCTDQRVFVNIENVPVCTRTDSSWSEIVKNKNDILWAKQ